MPTLRPKRCPLHPRQEECPCFVRKSPRRLRQAKIGWTQVRIGVQRAPDGREKCSKAELQRRKYLLLETHPYCEACGKKFEFLWEAELSHRTGKGIGGGQEDSRITNLVLLCRATNRDQGSMDLDLYLKTKWKPEICRGSL